MADNVSVTPGTGATVAAEEISGIKYQKIKQIDPTPGSTSGIGIVGNPTVVTLGSLIAGEDLIANVMKMEQRFGGSVIAADTLLKTGAGFIHALTFSCNDAAPTAGSIIAYDNTAESGTQLFNHTFTTTPFVPFTLPINIAFGTGLYIGFTTTADVNVTPSFR